MTNTSELPALVADAARRTVALGLNLAASGNVSARSPEGFWITPSGRDMDGLAPSDIVPVTMDGNAPEGLRPSSEWRFHRDIYAAFPQAQAIVHAHSPFAVALSCLRLGLPSFHYMVALAGGEDIRCAGYAAFGSQALSDHVLAALQDRRACLMANHGLAAWGGNMAQALNLALEVEALSGQYLRARQAGEPILLTPGEMAEALQRFQGYRQ